MYSIGDLITTGNNEKYMIFSKVVYQDLYYYHIIGYDPLKNDINGVCKIVKIDENDHLELVNDRKELALVLPLFSDFYTN